MTEPVVSPTGPPIEARPSLDPGFFDLPPPKPRRRGPDQLTRMLALILLLALAFSCGTRVGKQAAKPAAAPPAAAGAAPSPAGVAVAGQVKVVDGATFYVLDTKGQTVKVVTNESTRLVTTRPGSLGDLRPGDRVEVKGQRDADGTVSATELTDTPAEAITSPG